MVQIPESARPYWDFLVKYHFWLLAPLVPMLVLPALLVTNGKLSAEMTAKRAEIDGKLSALRQIDGITPHPNDTWTSDIDKRTARVKRETLAEWQRFWDSQADLRLWPAEIGADFLQKLSNLKAGRELGRPLLERYQLAVRGMAMNLPKRMGADVQMTDPDAVAAEGNAAGNAFGGPPGGPPGGQSMMMNQMAMMQGGGAYGGGAMRRSNALVDWNAADQQRVYESFHWSTLPKTKQILLAQEEMRLYELLCDQIAAINAGARGAYEAAIPVVDQLAVGYLAAEDEVSVSTAGRLWNPAAQGAGEGSGMMRGMMPPSGGGDGGMPSMMPGGMPGAPGGAEGAAVSVKPLHPRFVPKATEGGMGQGGMRGMMGMMPPGGGPPGSEGGAPAAPEGPGTTDEAFMTWIYVDADGKPLKGEEVATSPSALMTLLVPFAIRATIDQRKLDTFLVQLATHPQAPMEIRQIRLNPPAAPVGVPGMGSMMGGMMGGPPGGGMGGPPGGGMGGPPSMGSRRPPSGMGGPPTGRGDGDSASSGPMRPHDIVVEIRGTIALATPPDPAKLGLEADAVADPNAAGEPAEPDAAAAPEPAAGEPPADAAPAADAGPPADAPPADATPADAPPAGAPPADTPPAPGS